MSSLTDRLRVFDPGSRRFAPCDATVSSGSKVTESSARPTFTASRELDAETLDVVEKFEAAYSDFVAPAPALSPEADPARTAHLDLDGIDEELRKAFGEGEPSNESPARGTLHRMLDSVAPAAARAVPREDKEQNLSFEDAMATLRASEARGKAAAVSTERAEKDEPVRFEGQPQRPAPEPRQSTWQASPDIPPAEPLAANESWTARSRQVWPKVAVAAALALFVGTAVGYLAGKTPSAEASRASIATTPEGGAQLRFDYNLNKR